MTKKELIEGGWIDKYILGLTSEGECQEVERLANIYPEVQAEINRARTHICGQFNRNLTKPALHSSFLTKRRVLYGSAMLIALLLTAFSFLYKEHVKLQHNFDYQSARMIEEEKHCTNLPDFSGKPAIMLILCTRHRPGIYS